MATLRPRRESRAEKLCGKRSLRFFFFFFIFLRITFAATRVASTRKSSFAFVVLSSSSMTFASVRLCAREMSFQTPSLRMEYAPPISKADRATHRVSVNRAICSNRGSLKALSYQIAIFLSAFSMYRVKW